MPEGHSIHRYARLHRNVLKGQRLRVASPQGRFAEGAARLDGATLNDIGAHGKHLFYRWSTGDTLHVHLGLFGRFRLFRDAAPPPTEGTRLALVGENVIVYLAGPTICELIDPVEEDELRARLGPDPLRDPRDSAEFAGRLGKRRIPIGASLLDQKVIAGIGNVYRAELLYLTGIDPRRPASKLAAREVTALWDQSVAQLRRGEKSGRIITVDPADVGARRRSDIPGDMRLYVYKRTGEPCRRCGTAIATTELANRSIWWCPSCQKR